MSQTVADLLGRFRQADPADQQAVVSAILAEWSAGHHGPMVPSPGAPGRPAGYVPPVDPPPTTAAEDAELARRLATRHRSRPLSEFIRRLARPRGV